MQSKIVPIIFCRRPRCGEPAPFARGGLLKREMYFAGMDFLGQAVFLCPECGGRRMFSPSLGGPVKETTADGLIVVLLRRLLRGLLRFFAI